MIDSHVVSSFTEAVVTSFPGLVLLKVTGLVIVLLVSGALLKRYGTRSPLWGVGFAGLLLLPAASALWPWSVDVLPVTRPVIEPAPTLVDATPRVVAPVADTRVLTPPATAHVRPDAQPARSWMPSTRHVIFALWAFGAGLVLLRVLLGTAALRWLAHCGHHDDAIERTVHGLARDLGISRRIRVVLSPGFATPITWGIRHPVILLPAAILTWPAERRRAALLHELAHIKRFDAAGLLLSYAVCAAYWFHPLVWLAARRWTLARECACDRLVTAAGVPPRRYAQDLIDIARQARLERAPAGLLHMARPSQLRVRVQAIMDERRGGILARCGACVMPLVMILSTAAVAGLGPADHIPEVAPAADPVEPAGAMEPVTDTVPEPVEPAQDPESRAWRPLPEPLQRMTSDSDWSRYIKSLLAAQDLTPDDFAALIVAASRKIAGDGTTFRLLLDQVQRFPRNDHATAALLLATRSLTSDDHKRRMLGHILAHRRLDSANGLYFVQSITTVSSDGNKTGLLVDVPNALELTGPVRDTYFNTINTIASDNNRTRILLATVQAASADPRVMHGVLESTRGMASDGEKTRVLLEWVEHGTLDEDQRSAFFNAAASISSSGHLARVLMGTMDRSTLDHKTQRCVLWSARKISSDATLARVLCLFINKCALRDPMSEEFFSTVNHISNPGETRRVLKHVLQHAQPTYRMLLQVIACASNMSSDGEKAQVLRQLAPSCREDDRLRAAFIKAANTIASNNDHRRLIEHLEGRRGRR